METKREFSSMLLEHKGKKKPKKPKKSVWLKLATKDKETY